METSTEFNATRRRFGIPVLLVVSNSSSFQDLVEQLFAKDDLRVVGVLDTDGALAVLDEELPDFLLVADASAAGDDLIRWTQERAPELPIGRVVPAGTPDDSHVAWTLEKPVGLSDLRGRICDRLEIQRRPAPGGRLSVWLTSICLGGTVVLVVLGLTVWGAVVGAWDWEWMDRLESFWGGPRTWLGLGLIFWHFPFWLDLGPSGWLRKVRPNDRVAKNLLVSVGLGLAVLFGFTGPVAGAIFLLMLLTASLSNDFSARFGGLLSYGARTAAGVIYLLEVFQKELESSSIGVASILWGLAKLIDLCRDLLAGADRDERRRELGVEGADGLVLVSLGMGLITFSWFVVLLIAVLLVWRFQLRPPNLAGWWHKATSRPTSETSP